MNVSVRDAQVFLSLRSRDVATYLRATGWQELRKGHKSMVWGRDDEEVVLPKDPSLADYAHRLAEIVHTLSVVEARSELDIVHDLSTVSADILRFRLVQSDASSGEIPLEAGIRFVENVRDVVMSAACAAIAPKGYFANRKPDRALDYMREVRMGQSERGSYVIRVVSPVSPALGQLSLLNEPPFERRVTNTLAEALAHVEQAVDRAVAEGTVDTFVKGVPSGISANLCEALAEMLDEPTTRLDVGFGWSRARPSASVPNAVSFLPDMAPYIREAGRILRASAVLEGFDLEGVVVRLERGPSDPEGSATVAGFVEGEVRKVLVEAIGPDQYSLIVRAHDVRRPISCRGELVKEGLRYVLKNARHVAFTDE